MSLKHLTITVHFKGRLSDKDLPIRYILADTIESRKLGKIVNEGSGMDFMDITIETEESEKMKENITSMLESLGLIAQARKQIKNSLRLLRS